MSDRIHFGILLNPLAIAKRQPLSYIRLLSLITEFNLKPSVSMGRHWQQYLTADVYCYVRKYRDSICFVALNRGGATTLPEVMTCLPNGEHTCIVTRRKFEVVDGKIHNLELEERDAIVLSHVGERVKAQTIVRAQLNGVETQPGEYVVVIGDCPELGNWDIASLFEL